MTPDKKPNAAKNFYTKFSHHIKNATSAATSSPVAGMETVLLTELNCDALARRINQ
jgi:hypothetical protein